MNLNQLEPNSPIKHFFERKKPFDWNLCFFATSEPKKEKNQKRNFCMKHNKRHMLAFLWLRAKSNTKNVSRSEKWHLNYEFFKENQRCNCYKYVNLVKEHRKTRKTKDFPNSLALKENTKKKRTNEFNWILVWNKTCFKCAFRAIFDRIIL